ncbi:MAG: phosphatase PAP2 family protein [candidate division WS1 bacterium]|jgi:membrane-associated phospholipid phosphatase|nr:phosphatase PAP2 family protein [candidate division WS1 bacterium]
MADLLALDRAATLWTNHHHSLALDALLLPVSWFGERGAGWLFIVLLMLIFGKRRERLVTLAFLVVLVVTEFLLMPQIRAALPRPRPYQYLPGVRQCGVPWTTTSFPSAHVYLWVYATLFYGAIYRRQRWLLWTLTGLTMYARPYCGMHHIGDAMGGAVLGLTVGLPMLVLVTKWGWTEEGLESRVVGSEPAQPAHDP